MKLRYLLVAVSVVGAMALGSFAAAASDTPEPDPAEQVVDADVPPDPPWVRSDGTVDAARVPKSGLPGKVGKGFRAPDGASIETEDGQVIEVPVVTDPSSLTG